MGLSPIWLLKRLAKSRFVKNTKKKKESKFGTVAGCSDHDKTKMIGDELDYREGLTMSYEYDDFFDEDSSNYHPDADHEIASQFDEDEDDEDEDSVR